MLSNWLQFLSWSVHLKAIVTYEATAQGLPLLFYITDSDLDLHLYL